MTAFFVSVNSSLVNKCVGCPVGRKNTIIADMKLIIINVDLHRYSNRKILMNKSIDDNFSSSISGKYQQTISAFYCTDTAVRNDDCPAYETKRTAYSRQWIVRSTDSG